MKQWSGLYILCIVIALISCCGKNLVCIFEKTFIKLCLSKKIKKDRQNDLHWFYIMQYYVWQLHPGSDQVGLIYYLSLMTDFLIRLFRQSQGFHGCVPVGWSTRRERSQECCLLILLVPWGLYLLLNLFLLFCLNILTFSLSTIYGSNDEEHVDLYWTYCVTLW